VVAATIVDVAGVRIGHTTDLAALTGCTVIAFDAPALTAVEVRGAAPGTRELDLLAPGRTVQRADAILLTGGSAFGLRAADGVMQALAAQGRGVPTPAIPVPIVPAAVIYDLALGEPIAPTPEDGAVALRKAVPLSRAETGAVGAGTGARWGSIRRDIAARIGGFGIGQVPVADGRVTAFVVLNAHGEVLPGDDPRPRLLTTSRQPAFGQSTTLIAVVTDIACNHDTLLRLCIAAHDALARTVWPSHTLVDGDVAFASTMTEGMPDPYQQLPLAMATELAVEAAIRAAAGYS
jgi:L-aminopeptidase/D-esterase-like protein